VREGLNRLSPAVVLALFCLPLFIGLGRTDLQNDEAIYSFAVDRILEDGDWLTPKLSPGEQTPFLEKPPLKFWIVAAPIRLGLLPHDEFGLRFWDAVFGSVAFVYVFLIGRRVGGPLCGIVAVGVLFVHAPLVLDHGLRSNNMEAALLLAYCGGMYHFLEWARAPNRTSALVAALFFVLGFMTKFVAALFLPFVIVLAVAFVPAWRRALLRAWQQWAVAIAVAGVLIAPWFVYEHLRFGSGFWEVLVGAHVIQRMTVSIDPGHVHPWNHYLVNLYRALRQSETLPLAVAGGALLLAGVFRRRRGEEVLLLLWFAAPIFLISLSPSKLYHYAYPFLPPVAIAAGLVPVFLWRTLQPRIIDFGDGVQTWISVRSTPVAAMARRPPIAYLLLAVSVGAIVLAALAAAGIPFRWRLGRVAVLRNAQVLRPWIIAFVLAAIAGRPRWVAHMLIPLVIAAILPIGVYRATLARLPLEAHPFRDARDCVLRIAGGPPPGAYVQIMDSSFLHPYYYYFRRLGTWEWKQEPDDAGLYANLWGPEARRPVLVTDQRYSEFRSHLRAAGNSRADVSAPMVKLGDLLLILPGRYSACSVDARTVVPH
jgi:4-amino-4-deoxy-L-arabinose transferase-like glycosyltransferase